MPVGTALLRHQLTAHRGGTKQISLVFILCARSYFRISASHIGSWHTGRCPHCPVLSTSWENYSSKFLVALIKGKSVCYVCSLATVTKRERCEPVWFISPGWRDPRFRQGRFVCAAQRAVPRRSCGDADAAAGMLLLRRRAKRQPILLPLHFKFLLCSLWII